MSEKQVIELFFQSEGIPEIQLLRVPSDCTVRELIAQAKTESDGDGLFLMLEDDERELQPEATLQEVGIGHRHRVHCHRCRHIEVTVNFNGQSKSHSFSPAKTIGKIKHWADDQFHLKGVDATEHALQLCGTSTRPDDDLHLGSLVRSPHCKVCFDLVPKKRVEG